MRLLFVLAFTTAALAFAAQASAVEPTANATMPALYKKCANLNAKYPHGVGKLLAKDKTTGEPVTNFKRSNRIYKIAMDWNKRLDGDKDGIACEKR